LTAVFEEFKPEMVFHLAAQPIVKTSFSDPKLTFDTNLCGTVNMLEAVRNSSSVKAAIFITSDKCYENVEWEYGYRETDRLGGKDPYSASKACAEIAISAYWRSFLKDSGKVIASARAGNVIGGGDWAENRIVPDCVRAWEQRKEVVVRNPVATRPWQHVLEPLSGYLWLGATLLLNTGRSGGVAGEPFNFGPNADVNQPVKILIESLSEGWDGSAPCKIEEDPLAKTHEAGLLKLSCDKALKTLHWKATLNFAETVNMTGEWYQCFYSQKHEMVRFTLEQIESYVQLAKQGGLEWAK